MAPDNALFSPLTAHVLFWPVVTLTVFATAEWGYSRSGRNALLQPVLVSIFVLSAALILFGVPYADYAEPMRLFTAFLTPAIIALAVPLYRNLGGAREKAGIVAVTVLGGGALVIVGALALGMLADLDTEFLLPLTVKSVSAPIAVGISEKIGAATTLTILAVFTTGLPGATFGPGIMRLLRIEDDALRGLVLGVTSHAFGIARATEISSRATAFATIGMGLMGCFAAIAVPLILAVALG
jgi:putative effector of murein hydrolase